MRGHLDKKPSRGVAIGFFVFTLLIPFALAILLSNANAFFEADPVAVEIEGGLTAAAAVTI
jgi:hypothetical protein